MPEDLPVVEKEVEAEVPAEPEDGASAEQAQVQEDVCFVFPRARMCSWSSRQTCDVRKGLRLR